VFALDGELEPFGDRLIRLSVGDGFAAGPGIRHGISNVAEQAIITTDFVPPIKECAR